MSTMATLAAALHPHTCTDDDARTGHWRRCEYLAAIWVGAELAGEVKP